MILQQRQISTVEALKQVDDIMVEFARQASIEQPSTSIPADKISIDLVKIEEERSGYATVTVEADEQPYHKAMERGEIKSKWKEFTPGDAQQYLQHQPDIYKRGMLHMDSASAYVKVTSGFEYIENGRKIGIFVTEVHLLRRTRGYTGRAFGGDDVVVEISHMAMETGKVYGSVVAIMEHSFDPCERFFMCMVDKECEDVGLLIPINPAFPKIRILANKKNITPGCVSIFKFIRDKPKFERNVPVNIKTARTLMFKVQFLQWRADCYHPLGIAVEVVNNVYDSVDSGLRVLAIEYGLPSSYGTSINEKAKGIVPADAFLDANRRDLRDECVFTIDPEGAQDLDDAISVKEAGKGLYTIGIHIADVSHFVPKGGAIDLEARNRAESLYYRDGNEEKQVIHMLPNPLSTDLCSLLEGQDRLALTLMFTITEDGAITDVEIPFRSIINSKKCLSYKQAEALIKNGGSDTASISGKLQLLKSLTTKYRMKTVGNKSYSYEGLDAETLETPESHAIVQELMVITNKEIANFLLGKNNKCQKKFDCVPLRRQLPPSDLDVIHWMENYEATARYTFGLRKLFGKETDVCNCFGKCQCPRMQDMSENPSAPEISHMFVLQNIWNGIKKAIENENTDQVKLLFGDMKNFPQQILALLDMYKMKERAAYVCSGDAGFKELGHYDLNLQRYTHFTSPIRRYIDVVVHRLVVDMINRKPAGYTKEEVREICHHCTLKNRNSTYFEQETIRLQAAFKLKNCAEPTNAVVHAITDRGIKLNFYTERHCDPAKKTLGLKHLDLAKKPEIAELQQTLFMSWEIRSYNANQEIMKLDSDHSEDNGASPQGEQAL